MSALRSLVVWLVLSTQVWTPALAQTLPISVDKSVAGQRPVVGVSRGVPVVDIAPPSAGGVSNNRFTQFNVGPSGVVLNNSGAGRQTQLAGPVAGNPMLGNRHAGIILNQVTAPNPSQLAGMLEVAGHRASVIVANPAGISCDGCGFLNANRATLTTGKPVIGADGALGFDVTEGRLAIEGAGLYGANLGRLDLLARALEINAEVWADRLDVTAGAAHVDYASGAVAARTGDGPAPVVSLDTAALGGMYANSIRLIGTEAGVGVNIGGNLAALTGGLSVDVNGDVRIQPSGRLQAAADLSLRGAGDIVNDGALAAAGPLALRAGNTVANNGAISSGASAAIRGDTLDLSGGKLVAGAELALDAGGALANRGGALYGGSVTLRAGSLDNRGGKLASGATLSGRVMGALDNTGGTVAGAGLVDLGAGSIVNASGGVASAQDVRLHGDAGIDNRGGTIQAGGATRVDTGGAFDNRGGKLLGDTLALEAADVDNRDGVLRAEGQLALDAAGALRNQGGRLYGGIADVRAARIANAGGKVLGGELTLHASGTMDNTGGRLASQGDARLRVRELANADGEVAAGGALTLAAGDLRNDGRIHAGQDLQLSADTLTNGVAGELIGVRNIDLAIGGDLANAGLIDGGYTRIQAASLRNGGRVYGDRIAVQAPVLVNDADAVIASRGDMDLGADTLVNREHALLYAADDLRVGRGLDPAGLAAGQAGTLTNESATIEAGGDVRIAAESIQNLNPHFASEVAPVSHADRKIYYRLENGTELLDGATTWLCDSVTTSCGKDPAFLNDDPDRSLLLPSAQYPESRYGPPFDYVPRIKGEEGRDAPIPPAYAWVRPAGPFSSRVPVPRYKAGDRVWQVFGVPEPVPVPEPQRGQCDVVGCAKGSTAEREAALAINKSRHDELQARIRAFNADFNRRLVRNFFYYIVREDVSETRVTSTDPGRIVAGGDATFTGAVTNDKSRIIAGGALSVEGPGIDNRGAQGERRVTRVGTAVHTVTRRRHRNESRSHYEDTTASRRLEVAVGTVTDHADPADNGPAALPPATAPRPPVGVLPRPRPAARIVEVDAPGGQAVRVVTLPPVLPANGLYRVIPSPEAPALIVTDRQFIGARAIVSSDLLLRRINRDPGLVLKRLGDGFYEQKQVAEQIMLATGKRFVGDYTDNESQYKALLAAGADFAGRFGLALGTALTEDQMRQLSGDIVWMVETSVTLPDGSRQQVLAPQVYLAVKAGDLRGDGTLIAGGDTRISVSGDVANSGTLGARNALIVDGRNIRNTVGTLQGGSIDLNARNDIDNLAGLLKGGAVTLQAGRDVNLAASTRSDASGGVSSTRIDGVARIDAGAFDIRAGRDIAIQAGVISATGDGRLRAGHDIDLGAAETRYAESFHYDSRNRAEMRAVADVGTRIAAGGDLLLFVDNDVNARAADVSAGQRLGVGAMRDINVLAGNAAGHTYNETYFKDKGFLSSKKTHRKSEADWTEAVSSTFTGDRVRLMARRDVNVAGSNVAAQNQLTLAGGRDVSIAAVGNTSRGYEYSKVAKSGFGALGGISYGTRQVTDAVDTHRGLNTGSAIGSVAGNVLIDAGSSLAVIGSDVLARQGNIALTGRDIRIAGGADTLRQRELHEIRQTGLTVTASTPVVDAARTGIRMAEAGRKVDNPIMAALAGGTAGLAARNAYDAVKADPGSAGGARIGIGLGSSTQTTTMDRRETLSTGSRIAAGGDLLIAARGGGQTSTLTITGSDVSAGNDALLRVEGDILLRAASNHTEQNTRSKSRGASIGVSMAVGKDRSGLMLDVGVSAGRGREDGSDVTWRPSHATAGNVLHLQSGGDTDLVGASARGRRIVADIGRNLRIESMQDISTYAASNSNAGIAASICIYYCAGQGWSVSGSVGRGELKSDWRSVTDQAGLWAGDQGFQVDVGRNTSLVGGIIAGSGRGAEDGANRLSTGTLQVADVDNRARYSGHQIGISGGYNIGAATGDANHPAATGANVGEQAEGGARASGPGAPQSKSGLAANAPAIAAAGGKAGSSTRSAISVGSITIRDPAGQQALTNTSADEVIASLNRDTAGALNTLKPIFDKEKIQAGFDIASEAARQAGQFLTNRAAEAKALKDAMDAAPEGPAKEHLRARYEDVRKWAPGGGYREALTAVTLAAGGNVTGGASQFVQAAAVDYLQSLGAARIKEIAPLLGGEGSPGHVALHALLGCAGAAATGASCGAGASGASEAIVIGQLMEHALGEPTSKLDPVQREARINLVTSLLGGLTAALDPTAVAAVNDAARLELENNQAVVLPPPVMGPASIGGTLGGLGRRGSNGVSSADENIARHLTRAWNWLFETDSGSEEARGPLETPAVPPGGDARVPGYAGDRRRAEGTPGYEADGGAVGTPSYDADGNPYPGGSVTPMPEPQGPQIILNEASESRGKLTIGVGTFSDSEHAAARYMAELGNDVVLRAPTGTRAGGGTSDLLVNGVPYDVYTPITKNPNAIVSAIASKNTQATGIVLDLRNTSVTPEQLGNILQRVRGAGAKNITDIKIIGN
ncbi:MAG: hemagglutinin repeat-containing protein [Achromobacter xylosoxidans]